MTGGARCRRAADRASGSELLVRHDAARHLGTRRKQRSDRCGRMTVQATTRSLHVEIDITQGADIIPPGTRVHRLRVVASASPFAGQQAPGRPRGLALHSGARHESTVAGKCPLKTDGVNETARKATATTWVNRTAAQTTATSAARRPVQSPAAPTQSESAVTRPPRTRAETVGSVLPYTSWVANTHFRWRIRRPGLLEVPLAHPPRPEDPRLSLAADWSMR